MNHPLFDPAGYFEAIDGMRREFPRLRILTGLEFTDPPRWQAAASELVDLDRFDRVNGSMHVLDIGPAPAEPGTLYGELPPDDVMRAYLAACPAMVDSTARFEAVTHIDYAARQWPTATAGPFDPRRFEAEFRTALRAIAEHFGFRPGATPEALWTR